MKYLVFFLTLFVAAVNTATANPVAAAAVAEEDPAVQVELITNDSAIVPGQPFRLGIQVTLKPGWHVYYKEPGDTGRPLRVKATDKNFKVVDIQWQRPERFSDEGLTTYGYKTETVLGVILLPQGDLKPGQTVAVHLHFDWLACNTACVPGELELNLSLPVVAQSATSPPLLNTGKFAAVGFSGSVNDIDKVDATKPTATSALAPQAVEGPSFLMSLVLGFFGGMLLNLMPCVLPMISLKVLSFMKQVGQDRKQTFTLGMAYTAGTVSTFIVLALIVIATKAAGYSIGWGFQFQHPLFIIGMASMVTVMSLSLFGVFFVQISGAGTVEQLADREGWPAAFFKGVSATLLSTPCTAPLLGTAIGFAFAQPWWGVLTIFSTVGLGLSFPFLLLCWQPGWVRFLPKSGPWMDDFKHAMGLLMLGTTVWLLYILGQQAGLQAVNGTLAFLLILCSCAWLVGSFANFTATRTRRIVVWLIALALGGLGFWYFVHPALQENNQPVATSNWAQQNGANWEPYSEDALQKHLAEGKVVVVDFTAQWCLTCKVNEQILSSSSVIAKLHDPKVIVLIADWTKGDPEITKALARFNRSGVPLYVVYSPVRPNQPVVLPEIISAGTVIDALELASKP